MDETRWFKQHRMEWIAETLRVFGFINRKHLERKFGLSTPQASIDLNVFMRSNPTAMTYDKSAKRYVAAKASLRADATAGHALTIIDGAGWTEWPASADAADDIDDCVEMYGDAIDDETILTNLDLNNDCGNPGGHLWLVHGRNDVRCVHCDKPAMPVKASREA